MPATLRASYSFDAPVLRRFNTVVPAGDRSKVMENLMQQAIAAKEAEIARLADMYLSDLAFAECRESAKLWDVTVADGLENV